MPKDLIERAHKFAALAEKATAGPWVVRDGYIGAKDDMSAVVLDGDCGEYSRYGSRLWGKHEDLVLATAAPEMAQLLAEMADELEKLSAFWDWSKMTEKMQFLAEHNRVVGGEVKGDDDGLRD